ncbi:sphingomyelinase C [Streptomyces albireticuli]|uniref:Sphingomyelinase C n=1 Tax=Streptomyces albireticuli TaxID=1940 RepID=A0A1Z2KV77_9ACTN|nr:sphingomyelin phosphodiesterase [Streptomyces albireticuli]ARZ65958.1 sphingomyelinase C [Streptomyces albireticuli]
MTAKTPRTALAAAGAALILSPLPTGTAVAAEKAPAISVMAFNVEQLPSITEIARTWGSDRRTERATVAAEVIRRENPDVVVLDEAFNKYAQAMRTDLRKAYPHQSSLVGEHCGGKGNWTSYAGNCSNSPIVVNGGVTVLSKYPILESHQLVYSDSDRKTSDYKSNKGAALVRLSVDGAPVWVAGTHLQADEESGSPIENTRKVRLRQLRELRSWATEKSGGRPVIVAGDLNVEYHATDPRDGRAPTGAVSADVAEADGALGGKLSPQHITQHTYDMVGNARAKLRDDAKGSYAKYRNRLDYIGYINGTGPAPTFTDGRVVSYAGLHKGGDPLAEIPSDHQPLVSRVTVAR